MQGQPFSQRMADVLDDIAPLLHFFMESAWAKHAGEPSACDFAVGNPHEPPLAEVVAAFQRWIVPQHKDWFAYKVSEPEARKVVAESLRQRSGQPFDPEDIFLTNGAFSGLTVSFYTVLNPGDEVIFISPPWFYYNSLLISAGASPVRVAVNKETFDLDLEAIAGAITERTRAIIINSPHNPTGKIYSPQTLQALADLLMAASERNGRTIYLISDEAYNRIVFDGRTYHSPSSYYPNTFVVYTYGKTLLIPGQRIGYIALPPTMPDRVALRPAVTAAQIMCGFAFPNALMQYALPELEQLSIDVAQLQRRRDRLVRELSEMGYEVTRPEGTFYLLVRSPWPDDYAFIELLAAHQIFCLPGTVVELPGYFRISLTANDDMIERSLPGFAAALREAHVQAR